MLFSAFLACIWHSQVKYISPQVCPYSVCSPVVSSFYLLLAFAFFSPHFFSLLFSAVSLSSPAPSKLEVLPLLSLVYSSSLVFFCSPPPSFWISLLLSSVSLLNASLFVLSVNSPNASSPLSSYSPVPIFISILDTAALFVYSTSSLHLIYQCAPSVLLNQSLYYLPSSHLLDSLL